MREQIRRERNRILVFLLIFIALCCVNKISAQEYEYEIGATIGTSFYMGDANKSKMFQSQHLSGGAIFRYNRNFRWAYKANILLGQVSGNTRRSGNVFPNGKEFEFSRTFYEMGAQVEFNFFNYSDKYGYLGTKHYTPYIFTGLGLTLGSGEEMFTGVNLPLGIGFKYKIKDRLNLGFEFSFRKLFGDSFDVTQSGLKLGLDDPYNIKTGFFKNKDWYILTLFSVTWDFGQREKSCINSLY